MFEEHPARRAAQGRRSLSSLLERHGDLVYRIARNLTATAREAETVVEQTFLRAARHGGSPPGDCDRVWLAGLALEAARAIADSDAPPVDLRREAFLPRFDAAGRLLLAAEGWPDLGGPQLEGLLRAALECVDDDARAAFVLCEVAGLSAEEVARLVDATPAELRLRVHRATLLVRGVLDSVLASRPLSAAERLD